MNKEQFKQEDIDLWEDKINNRFRNLSFETQHPTFYEPSPNYHDALAVDNNTTIKIPCEMFGYLIHTHAAKYKHLLPYKVNVKYLEEDPENYWTLNTNYLGLHQNNDTLDLFLRKDVEHSGLSLLWILLHEFRHKIQQNNKSIESNLTNSNLGYLIGYLESKGNSKNNIEHVFHEIMPYEIDANVFACEILNIEYPSSKFAINDYTIGLLK